jgi:cell division protein FtsI/penicillin-binding protein 2
MVTALRRKYPFGDFAAQLLGYTSLVESEEELKALRKAYPDKITGRTQVGRAGIEQAYQGHLSGTPGHRFVARDEHGAFTRLVSEQPPVPGETLHLSVDHALSVYAQSVIERYGAQPYDDDGYIVPGYAPRGRPSGAFVMLDAISGDVLIWADMPRFDLDADRGAVFDALLESAVPDLATGMWRPAPGLALPEDFDPVLFDASVVKPAGLGLSRVSQIAVEPGSTFKPLIALALFHSGGPELSYFRCGQLLSPGCHCKNPSVIVESAISGSCNQFFAEWLRSKGAFSAKRHFVPSFLYQFGLGQRPADAFTHWSAGQLLRDWVDTPPFQPARRAAAAIGARQGRPVEVAVRAAGPLPGVVCGDMDMLASIFRRTFEQIIQETGIRKIEVTAQQVAVDQRTVEIHYDVAAQGTAGWHRHGIDYSAAPFHALPKRLQAAARQARQLGGPPRGYQVDGDLGRGGRIGFRVRFDRASGRTSLEQPVVLRKDDARNVAIGQGPVLATPLQMARAMAALSNGGHLVTPGVVARIGDQPALRPKPARLGLDPRFLGRVRVGMRDVVLTGTAMRSGLGRLGLQVFGKTGTAQVGKSWMPFDRQASRAEDKVWHHWFVGFAEAPGRRPVAFACVLHARREGGAGSTSAKAVAEILEAWGRN